MIFEYYFHPIDFAMTESSKRKYPVFVQIAEGLWI